MKRNVLILAGMAVTMLAIISCQKELEAIEEQENNQQEAAQEEVQPSGEAVFWIKASVEDTKTEMDGLNVHWVEGDQIVVNGETSLPLTSSDIHTDGTADFGFTTQPSGNVYQAIYPASAYIPYSQHGDDDVENAGQYYVELPKTQAYTQGKFDPEAAIMLAKGSDVEGLVFTHVMTYLRLTFNQPVQSVRVMANNGIKVRGYMKTVYGDSGNSIDVVTYKHRSYWNYNTVTMDCGGTVAAGNQIVIAIPPKSYSAGLNFFVVMPGATEHYSIIRTGALDLSDKAGVVIDQSFNISKLDKVYEGPGIYCETDWNSFVCAYESQFTTDGLQQENANDWLNNGEYNIYKDFSVQGDLMRIGKNAASYPGATDHIYFTGILNGNNHIITESASVSPMVSWLGTKEGDSGEIKYLTLAGNCTSLENVSWGNAAFAVRILRKGTINSCVNQINTTYTEDEVPADNKSEIYFGGFAVSNGGTIVDCTNSGNMNITLMCSKNRRISIGGIASTGRYSTDSTCGDFIRCSNGTDGTDGNITVMKLASGTSAQCLNQFGLGGICGQLVQGIPGTAETGVFTRFEECTNSGTIKFYEEKSGTASNNQLSVGVGGILGISTLFSSSCPYVGANDQGYYFEAASCSNTGTIDVSSANTATHLGNSMSGARQTYVGGIVGFAMGMNGTYKAEPAANDNSGYYRLYYCSNNSTIKVSSAGGSEAAGGILGGGGFFMIDLTTGSNTTYAPSDNNESWASGRNKVGAVSALVGWVVKRCQVVPRNNSTVVMKMDASSYGSGYTIYAQGVNGVTSVKSFNANGGNSTDNTTTASPLIIYEVGSGSVNYGIKFSDGTETSALSIPSDNYVPVSNTYYNAFYGKATTSGTFLRKNAKVNFVAF